MLLPIVQYGTPVLRQKGARIDGVTPTLALQLTVLDVRGVTDRPSSLELRGTPVDVAEFMPLVLMNPQITAIGKPLAGPEGCLSFPEIFGEITRPEIVEVEALDKEGKAIQFRCGGLLARAIQHETDHLHGILFIDRMDKKTKEELRPQLEQLQAQTKAARKK